MTDRIIKIKTHPNINLTVNVTDQMVNDYKECYEMATSSDYEDCKNCDSCLWWKMKLDCIWMCTLDEMKVLLEQEGWLMYRIMYKIPDKDWECLGSYNDIEIAAAELEKLKPLLLKEGCSLRMICRGDEKYLD